MPQRWIIFVAYITLGSCLALGALAWQPLWLVERPTGHLADMPFGTFWEFIESLPAAVENLSVPQEPETVLTILPTVYLWENVRTTLFVLTVGIALGLAMWWGRQWACRRNTLA